MNMPDDIRGTNRWEGYHQQMPSHCCWGVHCLTPQRTHHKVQGQSPLVTASAVLPDPTPGGNYQQGREMGGKNAGPLHCLK